MTNLISHKNNLLRSCQHVFKNIHVGLQSRQTCKTRLWTDILKNKICYFIVNRNFTFNAITEL